MGIAIPSNGPGDRSYMYRGPNHPLPDLRQRYIESACAYRLSREKLVAMGNADFDFSNLSVSERIQLAEDLWDSIPESADIALTNAQKAELDRRLKDLDQDPAAGDPWEVVRARLCGRLKRGE